MFINFYMGFAIKTYSIVFDSRFYMPKIWFKNLGATEKRFVKRNDLPFNDLYVGTLLYGSSLYLLRILYTDSLK